MKIAVAGSTGVLGRAVIPLLLRAGYDVRALARSTEKAKNTLPQAVELVECDLLSPDIDQRIGKILAGCDAVIHAATAIPRDFNTPNAWEANTRLRTGVVSLLLKASIEVGVKQYIQQSITMAYPDCGDSWITEDMPLDASPERALVCAPVITLEKMISAVQPDQMHWCILRGGSFVGNGTFQDQAIENMRAGRELIPCDGRYFVSLIHFADMAAAVVAAIKNAPPGSIFNIVDEPIRQSEYSDRLAASIGADHPRRDENLKCPPSWRCSNQHAKSILNWYPTHDLIPEQ